MNVVASFCTWFFAAALFCFSAFAGNDNRAFVVEKGQQFKICQELREILSLPENKHAINYSHKATPLIIPHRYKNFAPVAWESIPPEKLEEYIFKDRTKQALERMKHYYRNIEKNWDGEGDFIFEKTTINFDHYDEEETLVRYRLPKFKVWNCIMPDTMRKDYWNRFNFSGSGETFSYHTLDCDMFRYKGRIYYTYKFALSAMLVYEPDSLRRNNKYLYMNNICSVSKSEAEIKRLLMQIKKERLQ